MVITNNMAKSSLSLSKSILLWLPFSLLASIKYDAYSRRHAFCSSIFADAASAAFHVNPQARTTVLVQLRSMKKNENSNLRLKHPSWLRTSTIANRDPIRPFPSQPQSSSSSLFESDNPNPLAERPDLSTIPDDILKEIRQAESNTKAAEERNQRSQILTPLLIAFIALSLLNVLVATQRTVGAELLIQEFPLTLLTSNVGAYGSVLAVVGFGTVLLEDSVSKDQKIMQIYDEMNNRREQFDQKKSSDKFEKSQKKIPKSTSRGGRKKKKRQAAFQEMMALEVDTDTNTQEESLKTPQTLSGATDTSSVNESESATTEIEGGLLGKLTEKAKGSYLESVKDWYKQADSMAASQALLLNKKLEDGGFLEKITDESGLKVVGKEAAAEAKSIEKKEQDS